MEIAREIKDTENALKEFVASVLVRNIGENWMENCGLPMANIDEWRKKKALNEEQVKPMHGAEQPIFYADIEDIITLIHKNWEYEFHSVFGNKVIIEAYLKTLSQFLHPEQGRRELFVFQKHLLLGITGDIRTRITAYRSLIEVGKEGFPRIESIKDSFGNLWTVGKPMRIKTNTNLRVGDVVEYIITAVDPEQLPLQYKIFGFKWETSNILHLHIEEKHVARNAKVNLAIRSKRKFHAYPLGYDDRVVFEYQILPKNSDTEPPQNKQ